MTTMTWKTLPEWEAGKPKTHFSPLQRFYPANLLSEAPEHGVVVAQGRLKALEPELRGENIALGNVVDEVYSRYKMPFPLYGYQWAWVNAFADTPAAGMYYEVGAGKLPRQP